MVNVALVVEELPQTSVAVNTTVALPVAPHRSLKAVKSLLHVTLLQASVAVAPPLEANHAFSSALLPKPSQDTVKPEAGVSIEGAVVS